MSATMITAAIATIATVDAARITRALLSGEPAGETARSLRIVPARLREMRAREPNARAGGLASSHSPIDTFQGDFLPTRAVVRAAWLGETTKCAERGEQVRSSERTRLSG